MARRGGSLSFRLFLITTVWSVVVLVSAGLLLSEFYRQTSERRFLRELDLYLNNLVALVDFDEEGGLASRPDLQDPRFQSVLSGWYWQVARPVVGGAPLIFRSQSLASETLYPPDVLEVPYGNDFRRTFPLTDPAGRSVLAVQAQVLIDDRLVTLMVTGGLDDVEADVAAFRRLLFLALGLFGAGLLVGTLAVVWWGLRPFAAISRALGDIRDGRADRLEGTFPSEIQPLASEVNALIAANRDVVDRARTHVGNLAHALKTPLAVLANEAAGDRSGLAKIVRRQSTIMRQQIDYYLKRARVAGAVTVVGASHPVDETLEALTRTLGRITRDKEIAVERTGATGVRFRGEAQDFEEITGNLLENAFKWARRRVRVDVSIGGETAMHRPAMTVAIADDGPGLAPDDRAAALERGRRLDEQTPGSGLGLSIVADLVALYGGSISLEESDMGGLDVRVVLPRAPG